LIGIAIPHLIGGLLLAMYMATALSILRMFILRCLYRAAAAVAFIEVLGGIGHYGYAFFPVMVNSILLMLAGADYSDFNGEPQQTPKSDI